MKRSIRIGIAVLVLLTVVLAAVHLTTRTPETENTIFVNGKTVAISDLQLSRVTGTVVNGKGEKRQIDAQGISLSELCGDFAAAVVTATDEYSAQIKADDAGNAFLIQEDDGSLHLLVFGDENAKRDVKNVVRIETE